MRPRFSTLLRIAFAAGLTLLVLWRAHPAAVLASLSDAALVPIVGACLLVVADRVLMAARWVALLAPVGARRPPLPAVLRVFFVSTFVGTFLPASVGSDAVRVWSLSQDGVPRAQSLASVLMDRLLGIVSILISAAVGLALAPSMRRVPAVSISFAAMAAGCLAALALVFSVRIDEGVRRLVVGRLGPMRATAGRVLDGLQAYRGDRRMLAGVLLASIGVQALRILQAWLLGVSLGITAPLVTYFILIPIILLVMLLPITINGLGTSQFVFVWGFSRFGVSEPAAVALSILFVALGVVGNLPGGLLYARGSRRKSGAP